MRPWRVAFGLEEVLLDPNASRSTSEALIWSFSFTTLLCEEVPKECCVEMRRRSEVMRRDVYVFPEPVSPLKAHCRRYQETGSIEDECRQIRRSAIVFSPLLSQTIATHLNTTP